MPSSAWFEICENDVFIRCITAWLCRAQCDFRFVKTACSFCIKIRDYAVLRVICENDVFILCIAPWLCRAHGNLRFVKTTFYLVYNSMIMPGSAWLQICENYVLILHKLRDYAVFSVICENYVFILYIAPRLCRVQCNLRFVKTTCLFCIKRRVYAMRSVINFVYSSVNSELRLIWDLRKRWVNRYITPWLCRAQRNWRFVKTTCIFFIYIAPWCRA